MQAAANVHRLKHICKCNNAHGVFHVHTSKSLCNTGRDCVWSWRYAAGDTLGAVLGPQLQRTASAVHAWPKGTCIHQSLHHLNLYASLSLMFVNGESDMQQMHKPHMRNPMAVTDALFTLCAIAAVLVYCRVVRARCVRGSMKMSYN